MVRKIVERVPDETLFKDLDKYRQHAIELGATDAKIIPASAVVIDDRVRAKCLYPRCTFYGACANCPPYAMELDAVRKLVAKFRYAIFYMMKVPPDWVAGTETRKFPSQIKNYEINSKVEAEAFYDGYYLAVGFAGGSCKRTFCLEEECRALLPGQVCRQPLRSRSSMEAVGMDAFAMATRAGWDVYPAGRSVSPSDVPHGTRLGIVLIS